MNVWIVRDLEPLPTDPGEPRLLRAGLLATTLAALGHDVRWYTSTFNHYSRRQRSSGRFCVNAKLTIEVLQAPGYRRNIGIGRLLHNHRFAKAFLRRANASAEQPDVVVADVPTPEAAAAAVGYACRRNIPTVVTIRDLWPDFFAEFVSPALRPFVKLAAWPLDRQVRFACRNATALAGISEQYLDWGRKKGARARSECDRILPLGYDRPQLPDAEQADAILRRIGVAPDMHVVSYVGSWGSTYDLPLVLEAARLLAHRRDVLFVLAGNAFERPDLERAFQELDNVVLTGWIGPVETGVLLSRSAIALLPYARHAPQGLPNKIYECMAFGAYQIATLRGEAERLYSETGTGLSVSSTPLELAKAIGATLANHRILKARGQRMAIFDARFDAREIYREAVDQIVSTRRPGEGTEISDLASSLSHPFRSGQE